MQCASSITISPAVEVSWGSTLSRNPGLFSRSGLTSRTSTAPSRISAWTCSHSSRLAELIVRAWMPARAAASTWLRISASSGETMTVGPGPGRAQQRGRDEVHGRLAPAGPLHHQRPPLLGDEGADRRPLVVPQPRVLARQRPQVPLGRCPQFPLVAHGYGTSLDAEPRSGHGAVIAACVS